MVFHEAAPCVKVRRLRLRPGDEHHAPRTAVAFLETGRNGAKPLAANTPALHAAALAAQRPGGDFEDAACVRVAIGASAVAQDALPGSRERPLGQRCGIAMLDFLERLNDAATVGDGCQ